jgi:hypothetical protein
LVKVFAQAIIQAEEVRVMSRNSKGTSGRVVSLASKTLLDKGSSQVARQLAGSAMAQYRTGNQTGAHMEDVASRVLQSDKYSSETKALAASVLSQSNKER